MREDDVEARAEANEDIDYGALPVGARIGRFQISAILGQGGFGITYRARDEQLGRDVAIKEYLPSSLAVRQDGVTVLPRSTKMAEDFTWGRERFVAEGRTLASLNDAPAIVRVHDFLELNGTAYIVMELVRGDTLEARIRRNGKLGASEIDTLLWPLLDGLEQVHKAGFLHRDIKPANILLREDGRPTLIDFGASRAAMAGRTTAMTAIFTPGYAAAEQMTASRQGPWTDIYGLSATLYHAITGSPPPPAFERMLDDEYTPLSQLAPQGFSPALLAGLDAGLAVRAAERPQTIAGWRSLLGMSGPSAGDLTQRVAVDPAATVVLPRADAKASRAIAAVVSEAAPSPPARAWSRTPLYAGAAAAILLLAGGGGYLATRPASPPPTVPVAAAPPLQDIKVEDLERVLAERRAAEAAAADKRRAEEEAKRKAEAEAAAKVAADSEVAKAEAARQKAEAELAKLKAEMEARRLDQETQARKAEAEAAQRKAEAEMAALKAAEDEARRKAALEAEAKRLADEALAKAQAERQKADEEAQRKAAAEAKEKSEATARQIAEAEAKAKADAEAKAKAADADADKKSAEAAETALRFAMTDRQKVQVALTSLGFDTRGNDGAFGPRSREMIGAWQKARNLPATGFLNGAQHQALLREAAPALQKYDDDEKKKADEAKKKAEDEAKAAAATPATAPAAAAPTAPGAGPIPDGPYSGAFSSQHSFTIGSVINLKVTGTSATGTFSLPRCGAAPVNLKLSPSGEVSGDMTWFDSACGRSPLTVRGRASGRQMQLNVSGPGVSGASTLTPGAATPAAAASAASPPPAPQAAAPAPAVGGLRDGLYTGSLVISANVANNQVNQVSIRMAGGSGTGTTTLQRCGSSPISLRVDPAGRITGDLKFNSIHCDGLAGTITGRVEGGAMSLEMSGSTISARGRGTLTRAGD